MFLYMFALVGIVLLLGIAYYWYLDYSRKQQRAQSTNWPPVPYMREIGLKCPTGWEFKGERQGSYICENTRGIQVADPNTCYDQPDQKLKMFDSLNQWPISTSKADTLLGQRCGWIKQCGPLANQYATWWGVDSLC